MSEIKWINPGMGVLGLVRGPTLPSNYYTLIRPDSSEWSVQMRLTVKSGYSFNCCGAGELSSLSGYFSTDKDLQETALALYNFFTSSCITYYAIAATYQFVEAENIPKSVLRLLLDLGMVEVHKTPNRNHGPNDMHMLVLDPNKVKIPEKYIWKEPSTGLLLPKYVEAMDKKAQQALMAEWLQKTTNEVEQRKKAMREETEQKWLQQANAAHTLFHYIQSDSDRKAAYAKRGLLEQFQPQISEKVKEQFFRNLRAHGWSNSNEQQQSNIP